jgi:hypothetical protein
VGYPPFRPKRTFVRVLANRRAFADPSVDMSVAMLCLFVIIAGTTSVIKVKRLHIHFIEDRAGANSVATGSRGEAHWS